jgi:hypothetical protein
MSMRPPASHHASRCSWSLGAVAGIDLRIHGIFLILLGWIVDCHLARIAALGHDDPEMPRCPSVPRDVGASVSNSDTGFDVDVRSWEEGSAREVLRRARALVGGP